MSFSFSDPQSNHDRAFSFTEPNSEDLERQLQAIADMAHQILRLVAEVRRHINN
ncbi:hypothetical protein [Streptomyces sp. NPDC096030]|uniref:hypothetical protein n=1 Tax=Streptomyces sp. NPDC096030 TaxID=3155423 RepID=UPI00332ED6C3